MGKRNKQLDNITAPKQQKNADGTTNTQAPHAGNQEQETIDNLKFEDPFEDEYEVEEEYSEDMVADGEEMVPVRSWNPLTSEPLEPGTTLEIEEAAYKMHHALTSEWPSLSFSILRDNLGENRTRFPHTMLVAVGSQADRSERNKLTIMKLSDMARTGPKNEKTEKQRDDDMIGEEYDAISEDDDDSDEEEIEDVEPVLEHFSVMHNGGVNRLRAMPQLPEIIATWSDTGVVNLFDVKGILDSFNRSTGNSMIKTSPSKIRREPFFVYQGHTVEGYAMDWSRVTEGVLATGDCNGHIHLWQPFGNSIVDKYWNNSSFSVLKAYAPTASGGNADTPSVEDIQWSPTESTVFATGECGGYIRIYDTRCQGRPMISNKIHDNCSDVNVISWNALVSNLMASGGHDGTFSVWDLRNFQPQTLKPLARFKCHKKPITSLEWHPTDESMIVVTDEDATYIYDLSIEEDNAETKGLEDIPPQLLFIHCGSESTKEAHWHPQIPSCVMTTALSGYSVFIPSNL